MYSVAFHTTHNIYRPLKSGLGRPAAPAAQKRTTNNRNIRTNLKAVYNLQILFFRKLYWRRCKESLEEREGCLAARWMRTLGIVMFGRLQRGRAGRAWRRGRPGPGWATAGPPCCCCWSSAWGRPRQGWGCAPSPASPEPWLCPQHCSRFPAWSSACRTFGVNCRFAQALLMHRWYLWNK